MIPSGQSQILDRFLRLRRDDPERPIVHLPLARTSLSAGDLWESAVLQGRAIERLGIGRDDLLLYAGGNRPELLALWLACRVHGLVLMPADAGTTASELRTVALRFGATHAIVADPLAIPALGEDARRFGAGLAAVRVTGARRSPELHHGAAVLKLTSGSTGLPKATLTTEAQLVNDAEHIIEAMDIRPGDCQMAAIPLSHAYGIGNLVLPLLLQGTAMVLRDGFVPHRFATDAAAYNARVFPGVPFMFEHFNEHLPPGAWPPGLERLISAGAPLEAATARDFRAAFGAKIHSFYGTSETGGIAFDDSTTAPEERSVGRPLPGVTVTLRPADGAPPGDGRVHVSGNAVASGYAGDQRHIDGFTEEGFLTGDLGRFDGRGHLLLTGRASAAINVAGRKVHPDEVEAVLREMPEVADVRVLAAPDRARGQQIVACIVSRSDRPSLLRVRQFCGARLAPHKIPRAVVHLDHIPRTERGKTDRRRLQALVEERLRELPEAGVL